MISPLKSFLLKPLFDYCGTLETREQGQWSFLMPAAVCNLAYELTKGMPFRPNFDQYDI